MSSTQEAAASAPSSGHPSSLPVVEVIAPASLRAGYTFDVEVNHEVYTVAVPYGGVTVGQKFRAPTQPKIEESTTLYRIPLGLWKDELFEFCKFGPCHPSFLLSFLFPLISLGQIYTRLDLRWNASPHPYPPSNTNAFKTMVAITLLYMFAKQVIAGMEMSYHTLYLVNLAYMIIIAILVGKTRKVMREMYDIPGTFTMLSRNNSFFARIFGYGSSHSNLYHTDQDIVHDTTDDENDILPLCCAETEDYCLGGCCFPCVISQMNRHTAMYDTYEGSCCSSNGLPKHAPRMV